MNEDDGKPEQTLISRLERRLEREKTARRAAEAIAEEGLRQLYQTNGQLTLLNTVALSMMEEQAIEQTMQAVLGHIANYLNADIGRVCVTSVDLRYLFNRSIWFHSGVHELFSEFRSEVENQFNINPIISPNMHEPIKAISFDEYFGEFFEAIQERYRLKTYISIPLVIVNEIPLVLEFFSSTGNTRPNDIDSLMRQIGGQISIQLERELIRRQRQTELIKDSLTGLTNRRFLQDTIEKILNSGNSDPAKSATIFVIGYDNFRHINDTFGHNIGDKIIQEGANRIKLFLENFPSSYMTTVGRLAGDEFALIIENVAEFQFIEQVMERLLLALSTPYESFEYPFKCTASGGLVHFNKMAKSSFQIFSDADTALQYAKQKGGSKLIVFSEDMRQKTYRRRILAANVIRGLAQDEFILHYQPLIAVASRRLIGFEALIRWRNTDGTLLNPIEFLPIADQSGLTIPIGQWVLKTTLSAVARWSEATTLHPDFKMGINISPNHFMTKDFGQECLDLLESSQVHPDRICLEIIESTILENNPIVLKNFDLLRTNGIAIAIDDFGTGYSSLSYLQKYQPDIIKIDKEFIFNVARNSESQKIVSAIIELADKLGVSVIAEGVENEDDFTFLTHLGCDFAQGYLFSRPVSELAASEMLIHQSSQWIK